MNITHSVFHSEVRSKGFSPPHRETTTEVVTTNVEFGGTYHV